jgi:hypothetical protein
VPRLRLRCTVVLVAKATDALTPPNPTAGMLASNTIDQLIAESLMVAFAMVVLDELVQGPPVSSTFMRVNSTGAHQLRPPPIRLAGPADLCPLAVVDVRNLNTGGQGDFESGSRSVERRRTTGVANPVTNRQTGSHRGLATSGTCML